MAYLWLKLFHIILAILSVGFGASYGLLVARGRAAGRGELAFALRTIQAMDRIATAGYVLLLVTGMGLVHLSGLSMRDRWLYLSVMLWFIAFALGIAIQRPALRRMIALLDERGPADAEFQRLSARSRALGGVFALLTLVILYFMVHKPL
jgi:uncharacterized membrane protein